MLGNITSMPCKGKCAKEKPIKGSYKDNSANSNNVPCVE